ncbi:hypothetical protein [Methylomonas sp. CM2]|uniref:hypothetical protein n=1 Tax=Methylomonas sp. CM2 TaxID=3417647 RepID=UPI003CF2EBD8
MKLKAACLLFAIFFSAEAESKPKKDVDLSKLSDLEKCKLVNKISTQRKYFYKVEKTELVTVIYLSVPFYSLKFDERELVAQCMFMESKSIYPETKAVTFNDDETGKFIGIYTPEKGLTLGR